LYFVTTEGGSDKCIKVISSTLFSAIGSSSGGSATGQDGVSDLPPYMQDGVGTSGSEEERKIIARDIELALTGGVMELELTREAIDHSIDKAIRIFRMRAAPYKRAFFPMSTGTTRKKRFVMTNKKLDHDKIIRVMGSSVNTFANPMISGPFIGRPGGDLATYFLESTFVDEMETLMARRITFFFNEHTRILELHNNLPSNEPLLIEAATEMTEQEIMMDRRYRPWIERWAVAESQLKLAEVRGRFQTIPGPNGGIVMNAAELRAAAQEAMTALLDEITNFIAVDVTEFPGAFMSIG
jgi:hypothetical protein